MAIKKEIEINVKSNVNQTTQQVNNLNTSMKQAGNTAQEMNTKLSGSEAVSKGISMVGDAVSKLNPALGGAIKGADGLIMKMWQMVANPIGAILAAIVVTLKFLYEAFESSVAGGKELKAVFAAVSAVGAQVKDAVFGLGRALINTIDAAIKFIKLDFKGAAESMKKANKEASESYKQLGNAVDGTTAKIIYNLTKQQQANDKAKKIQAVTQSETNKLLVKSRETLTDETASLKEKKKALEEVTKAEKASSAEKVRIAAKDLEIAKAKAKALGGEAEKKLKGEIRDLTIAVNEAETENAMTGIKLNKQRKMLNRQEAEDAKAANEQAKQLAKERSDAAKDALKTRQENEKAAIDEQLKNTKLSFEEQRKLVNDDKKLSEKDRKDFLKRINDEEKKAIEDHKKAIVDLENKYKTDLENLNAKTDQQKLDLQKKRDLDEINRITTNEEERAKLLIQFNEKYQILQAELDLKNKDKETKTKLEQTAKDIENANLDFQTRYAALAEQERLIKELTGISEEERNKLLEDSAKKRKDIAKSEAEFKEQTYRTNYNNLQNILSLGGKGMQKVSKAFAIADVVRTAALSVSKSVSAISAANAGALATPQSIATSGAAAVPAIIRNTIQGGLQIGSTIASAAKSIAAINSEGKSAPTASAPASGGGGGGGGGSVASAPPQFNIVGGSTANQLASTLGSQQPIQAFVVANQVTSQQAMDRNILNNASIG
jgi:hypothetical protein